MRGLARILEAAGEPVRKDDIITRRFAICERLWRPMGLGRRGSSLSPRLAP
jgi:hypothetical protein